MMGFACASTHPTNRRRAKRQYLCGSPGMPRREADKRCTDSQGKVTTTTDVLGGLSNDIVVHHFDTAVRIGSGGLTVSGTGAQTSE